MFSRILSTFKRNLTPWDYSFLFTVVVGIAVLFITELKAIPWKMFANVSNIITAWIVFTQTSFSRNLSARKFLKVLWVVVTSVVIFYFFIRLINVYSLVQNPSLTTFCSYQVTFCAQVSELFYLSKFYRFVTLSAGFILSSFAFMTGLLLIAQDQGKVQKYIKLYRQNLSNAAVGLGVLFLLLNQLLVTGEAITELSLKSWDNRKVSFLDRFVSYEYGIEHHGWIWEYGKFVTAHTPSTAVLFLPPQNDTWAQEGNKYYFRWFVYPRTFTQSSDHYALIPPTSEFQVISGGGWVGGEIGWPKTMPKQECLKTAYLIDRTTLDSRQVSPEELSQTLKATEWGIMELNTEKLASCQ